ncbi:hemin importer ATP-binding subunit [Bosea sp. LC85]|uniref:AAA family ATPase n=1 Tax=Bosea sp. LC85 TaxID=1502851 RepID=UPI0004E310BA|nr:AAA family ATPase [Bosea sp. LC85]KFC65278.1 hemin importer ATP-binding subunit [Bosea sp. LC85]
MRIDWLKIHQFKNLGNVEINFDKSELSTVLVGENGTGKSNVIEALATIFRDLDLGTASAFEYAIAYKCHGHHIVIDNSQEHATPRITVDGKSLSRSAFRAGRSAFLPSHVFGYYSGSSRRLEQLFDKHQLRYYKKVISPRSSAADIHDMDLRRLFYCRPAYGQLALLSYFAFGSESAKAFLKKNMGIVGFDSALIILRRPRWADGKEARHRAQSGKQNFWNSSGLVRTLLDKLWAHALAPIEDLALEQDDYRAKPTNEEQIYLFIEDLDSLNQIAAAFGDERTFFALLETLDISDLIREVRIWVAKDNVEGEIPFHEISDGEKQLLSVLGLMRFTSQDESLFLLDEPDTHLNPNWKWDYLHLVDEVARQGESHIILTTHDPLTIGSLKASQVQVFARADNGEVAVRPPDVDPRGLGFTSILTQIFGLPTTLDPATQGELDERNELLRVKGRTQQQERRLLELSQRLRRLGFVLEDREPEYELFLRALTDLKHEGRAALSPETIAERNNVARMMLARIMEERGARK